MGNNCCCIKDDGISKLDEDLKSLIHSKKTQIMTVNTCVFCRKENVVCFQNYGSLRNKIMYVCICCDIDLNRKVLC